MKKDLISIIIPVYNVEKYIEKCLESVINQTYNNIEIILIDDGSLDDSGKICDEYAKKDKRIVVIHKNNEGVSVARNVGIKKSKGKYVAFIDSDDYVEENYVEKLYITIDEKDMAIVGAKRINEKGKIIEKSSVIVQEYSQNEAIQQLLLEKIYGPELWGKLFKTEILKKLEFRKDMTVGEDFDLLYRYLQYIQRVKIDTTETLYNYILRNGSIMNSSFNPNWFKDMQVCEKIINNTKDEKTKKYAIKRCIRSVLMCAAKILKDTNFQNSNKNEEYLKVCKDVIKKYGINSYYKASTKDKIKIFLIANCTEFLRILYKIKANIK